VLSDCNMMATQHVLGLIAERASHVRKCPLCNEVPLVSRGYGCSSTISGVTLSGERLTVAMQIVTNSVLLQYIVTHFLFHRKDVQRGYVATAI
jgi:hypothetical protein